MVLNLLYRRPSYVGSFSTSTSTARTKELSPISSGSSATLDIRGIPDSLSFDRIVAGGTCPPVTCRDFMRYLIYIEHAAENLQFYLWLLDYTTRFQTLSANEQALSPEMAPFAYSSTEANNNGNSKPSRVVTKFFADSFSVSNARLSVPSPTKENPFGTPPQTPGSYKSPNYGFGSSNSGVIAPFLEQAKERGLMDGNHAEIAAEAFQGVDMKWQPFTIQPFREEISRVIAIYIAEGAPRELNLSARDRVAALRALAQTTHPSALEPLKKAVEDALQHQAHPNFIRWCIKNGNQPRIVFAVGLGVALTVIGFIIAVLLTLSEKGKGWRVLAAISWVIGISTLIAASKGMCVVLHGLHHRHVRPWELWDDENNYELNGDSKLSLDSENTCNSFEDEPWVAKYESRNIIRKVFDREVWVEEPALRQIQDRIFWQSIIASLVSSAILTGIFVSLPRGGFFS